MRVDARQKMELQQHLKTLQMLPGESVNVYFNRANKIKNALASYNCPILAATYCYINKLCLVQTSASKLSDQQTLDALSACFREDEHNVARTLLALALAAPATGVTT